MWLKYGMWIASLLIKNENNLKFDATNFEPYVVS